MHFKLSKYVGLLIWGIALVFTGLIFAGMLDLILVNVIGWMLTGVGVLMLVAAGLYFFLVGELVKKIANTAERIRKQRLMEQPIRLRRFTGRISRSIGGKEYYLSLHHSDGMQQLHYIIGERSVLTTPRPEYAAMPVSYSEALDLLGALERLLRENADAEQRRAEQVSRA